MANSRRLRECRRAPAHAKRLSRWRRRGQPGGLPLRLGVRAESLTRANPTTRSRHWALTSQDAAGTLRSQIATSIAQLDRGAAIVGGSGAAPPGRRARLAL